MLVVYSNEGGYGAVFYSVCHGWLYEPCYHEDGYTFQQWIVPGTLEDND